MKIKIWNVSSGIIINSLTGHSSIKCIAIINENLIVSGCEDYNLKIWNIKEAKLVAT